MKQISKLIIRNIHDQKTTEILGPTHPLINVYMSQSGKSNDEFTNSWIAACLYNLNAVFYIHEVIYKD